MIEKNQTFTATVEAVTAQGEGVVKLEGITFFIPYTLSGEVVEFKVLKVKDNVGYGKCLRVLEKSQDRVEPTCPVFEKCGGCQLQHMTYSSQLELKREQVRSTLKKIGNLEVKVPLPVPSQKQWGYRNKLQLPIGKDGLGNNAIGFYAQRSHRIIPITSCAIHPEWATGLIALLYEYMQTSGAEGYDEEKKTGLLRHVVVREMDKKFIVTLVATKNKLRQTEWLLSKLKGLFPAFTLVLNVNTTPTNVIFGDKFITLYGNGFFNAKECGITFEAGAQTFVQINENIRGAMYQRAIKEVAATGEEVVVDCYSGTGLLTAMVAKQAKRAYGIEIEPQSSECADRLKEQNKLENMYNVCGAVEDKLSGVLEREKGEKITLILDPPRAGIHRSVLHAIEKSGIEKMVLISCNPATLARDLGLLCGTLKENEKGELVKGEGDGNYTIAALQPYDMFPQTKHVETLVVLQHKNHNI